MILGYKPQTSLVILIEGLPNLCCHLNVNSHVKNVSVIKKNEYMLRTLAEGDPKMTKYIIYGADRPLIHCFIDCAHNIVEGNIPLGLKEKKRLGKYKQEL